MIRALYVDDDPYMQRMVNFFLKDQDIDLEFASNGRLAIRKLESQSYDIILSDIQMPEIDGEKLIQQIRLKDHHTPIIVITAFGSKQLSEKLASYKPLQILPKPFERQQLIRSIHEVVRS